MSTHVVNDSTSTTITTSAGASAETAPAPHSQRQAQSCWSNALTRSLALARIALTVRLALDLVDRLFHRQAERGLLLRFPGGGGFPQRRLGALGGRAESAQRVRGALG